MSRTRHALPSNCHHKMKVQNRRKQSEAVLDEMIENGVPFLHHNRVQSYMTLIPEPWDDKPVAAWSEYHNKVYWPTKLAQNDEHYTRNREILVE